MLAAARPRSASVLADREAAADERIAVRPLVTGPLGLAARLEQEPAALFGLIDEHLEEACGRHVFVLVGELVRGAHVLDLRLIVVHQLDARDIQRTQTFHSSNSHKRYYGIFFC